MQIDFMHQPGNTAARVRLAPGETLTAEGGAMIVSTQTSRLTLDSSGFVKTCTFSRLSRARALAISPEFSLPSEIRTARLR